MAACPGDETLAEFVCRRLGDANALEVETHVADCATCRKIVGTLAVASLPRFAAGSTTAAIATGPAAPAGNQRYVIQRELARGGMGRISIAEDTLLHRTVAIKEIAGADGELAARFW